MSLGTRFAAYFSLVVLSILGAASFFFYHSQKAEVLRQVHIQQEQTLAGLVKVCEESLLNNEDIALLNYLRALTSRPEVAWADLAGPEGLLLAHPDPTRIGDKVKLDGSPPFLHTAPVNVHGRKIGQARLAYEEEAIRRQIRQDLKRDMVDFARSVLLWSLLLGLLAGWLCARALTRPFRLLVEGARRIGKGKFDSPIALERNDELGQLASEFNRMAVQLGELDRMKEEFIQSVTHDLRNPLSSIIGYADLLLSNKAQLNEEAQARYLKTILHASGELNGMISEILDLAKFEAGMMDLHRTSTDMAVIMREVHEMFLAPATQRHINLALDLNSDKVPASIDVALVRRVIENLISNALKFTPRGGTVTLELRGEAGKELICAVRDTGPGIPADKMGRLFQKFQQIPGVKSVQGERGTGIGLALSKRVIEGHGGVIGAESEPQKGSRFYFTLPARQAPGSVAGAA